jgi:adenylate kinase family enzyme
MVRVAVIGNAGGGKSTMCRQLSEAQGLPLFPIDRIQWKPGWVSASYEEIKQRHDAIIATDCWIIDGWGPIELIEERFAAADTIILIDLPLFVHYWWSIERQIASIFRPRPDGPEGCPMLPMTWPLLKMIWNIHHNIRPGLIELVNRHCHEKQVFHIRSPRGLRKFINEYCK